LPTFLEFWGNLEGPWHSVHVWKAWPKTYRFLSFMAVFVSSCSQFGSGIIYKLHDSWYMFERNDQKLIIFMFYWRIHELLSIGLGFRCDFTRPMTLDTCLRGRPKTHYFQYFMAVFVSYCP
jgi:hypothetical protein